MTDRRARIRAILAATFGALPAGFTDASGPSSIPAWDSMNHIHLLVALEAELGVAFDPEVALDLTSVDAIDAAVTAALGRG